MCSASVSADALAAASAGKPAGAKGRDRMKITNSQNLTNYYTKLAAAGAGRTEEKSAAAPAQSAGTQDVVDFSAAGKAALQTGAAAQTGDSSAKSYDLAKVLEIHQKRADQTATKDEVDYYWNARASDPKLDAQLYEQDKAEALSFVGQVQNILMKATSGQKLSAEEQKMVDSDPALRQEIELRKSRAALYT